MPFPCETSHNALASSPPTDSHQRESTHLSFCKCHLSRHRPGGLPPQTPHGHPKPSTVQCPQDGGGHYFKQNHRTASSLTLWCYSAWAKSLNLQLCQCQWLMAARDVVLDPKANHSAWGVDELWWYSMWWRIHVSSLFQHPALSPMFIMCLKAKAGKGEHGKTSFTSTGVSTLHLKAQAPSLPVVSHTRYSIWLGSKPLSWKKSSSSRSQARTSSWPSTSLTAGRFFALTTETW